jgi:hypothetical protein
VPIPCQAAASPRPEHLYPNYAIEEFSRIDFSATLKTILALPPDFEVHVLREGRFVLHSMAARFGAALS